MLEVCPHTALQEHILNARIEYMSSDISSITARGYTSRISGIVSSYNSSSDHASLSIYGQALRPWCRILSLMAYYRLFHSSGSVQTTLTSTPATTLSVPPDYEHFLTTDLSNSVSLLTQYYFDRWLLKKLAAVYYGANSVRRETCRVTV